MWIYRERFGTRPNCVTGCNRTLDFYLDGKNSCSPESHSKVSWCWTAKKTGRCEEHKKTRDWKYKRFLSKIYIIKKQMRQIKDKKVMIQRNENKIIHGHTTWSQVSGTGNSALPLLFTASASNPFGRKRLPWSHCVPSLVSLKPDTTIICNNHERKKYPRRPPSIHEMNEVMQQSQKLRKTPTSSLPAMKRQRVLTMVKMKPRHVRQNQPHNPRQLKVGCKFRTFCLVKIHVMNSCSNILTKRSR